MTPQFDPQQIFERLHAAGVRHVIIGGWAVNAHGHRRYTGDVDICPDPAFDNLERLARLLTELNARRPGISVHDKLGYARLAEDAIHADVFGTPVTICSPHALLEMKRAAGRPQDLEDLRALQALKD